MDRVEIERNAKLWYSNDACAAGWQRLSTEDYVLSLDREAAAVTVAPIAPPMGQPDHTSHDPLLTCILSSLDSDKAEDVVAIDLRGRSEMADHMVIASGRSSRQVAAMSEKLAERAKEALGVTCKVEGKEHGDWVLIDAGDVIVHVFRPEVRAFYQLEKMWMPAGDPRA